MTIKEALIRDLGDVKEGTILPFSLQNLPRAFTYLLYVDSSVRVQKEAVIEVLRLLSYSTSKGTIGQTVQLAEFLKWWLEQDANGNGEDAFSEEEDHCWYDTDSLINKWNEFATLKRGAADA